MGSPTKTAQDVDQVDVRGPRFAAWVTTAVLVVTLIVSSVSLGAAAVILAVQAVVFAVGAVGGPRKHPYGLIFAKLVAPRLAPVTEKEPVPPLKFAQLVGFVFAVVGAAGFGTGTRHPRADSDRIRFGRRVPQRRLRHLPWLPALPAGGTTASLAQPCLTTESSSNRKDLLHGTLRRPGHD